MQCWCTALNCSLFGHWKKTCSSYSRRYLCINELYIKYACRLIQVKADDIVEKSSGSAVFCIIDCPNEYYLRQLQTNQELLSHQENGSKSTPTIVIHLSPAQIVQTQDYQAWTAR